MSHITDTQFFNELMRDIYGPRSGGAIIIVDAENARKGVGKTGLAVGLGQYLSNIFGYDMKREDCVLSGKDYLQRLEDHPGTQQPSVVVWDEAVGGGSGDSRRSMAEQNRVLGQAWQTLRTKRIVQIVTLPDWNDLDTRLQKLADYRLWCREKPIGVFQPYKITTPFNGNGIRTVGLGPSNGGTREIKFPNLDAYDDPLYEYISEQKDRLIDADGTYDADDVLGAEEEEQIDPEEAADQAEREMAIKTVLRSVRPWDDERGDSYSDAAKLVGFSQSWVSNRVQEWKDGAHRDLLEEDEVPTP